MEKTCDLHAHSIFSDGTYSPEQLISAAREIGISAVALTDHNTVAGLPDFVAAAENTGVEAVPGVEFSTEYEGTELHILGLYIQPTHYGEINALLGEFLKRKEQANKDLISRLGEAGMVLDYEHIKAQSAGSINRAVIASELMRLGYCESVKEAFSRWLSFDKGFYIPPVRPDAYETIAFIKSIGAVAVLAHPFLNLDEQRLRGFLPRAVERGLDGMEVYYPLFDGQTTALAGAIAAEFGLLESGGSDFHGENKPHIRLGTGMDNLSVPLNVLNQLKKRCKKPA